MSISSYDWIVIGAGITGASLAYELAKQGFKVLLLEKDSNPANATHYSYGGLAYWSGTTSQTRQLFAAGIELHRNLGEELEADTGFREIDLLLTIDSGENPETYYQNYSHFVPKPELLSVAEACTKEPLLNPKAIAGVLKFPHGQINPTATTQAYQRAFCRLGGDFRIEKVQQLQRQGNQIRGVITKQNNYSAANTVLCAGGFINHLLQSVGISYQVKFTHEQVLVTPSVHIPLNSIIMPANFQRHQLEQGKVTDAILDLGAVPFQDGHLLLGQLSTLNSNPDAILDHHQAQKRIREGIATLLPSLADLPANIAHCLVTFADPNYPLVGALTDYQGIYLFTGFTATLLFAPILAKYFPHSPLD